MKRINFKIFLLFLTIFLAFFLRFYKLNSNPPSLYWEEAALGYDAYSILKTAKDYHGNPFPIVAFESFGDWKPSLYFYALVPAISVFGLNEFGVRFPSAFFGSLTVLLVFFLTKEFIKINKKNKAAGLRFWLPLTTSLILAVSPWHLQFSRAGFEANLALFLIVLGIYLFLKALNANIRFLLLSAVSFGLSFYAYHAARVFVPLLVISLGMVFIKKLWKEKKVVLICLFLGLILISPIIKEYKNPVVQSRFQTTSAFSTLDPILESNKRIKEDGNNWWARVVHHRFWFYADIFINNYLSHFSPEFLFFKGDVNPRHSTGEFGLLYLIEAPFLLAGIYFAFRKKEQALIPVFIWLFLAAVPAGMTKAVPHALRFLTAVPTLQIIIAYGIVNFGLFIKKKMNCSYVFPLILGSIYLFFISQYLHFYHQHYPEIYSQHWQYGYKEMINFVLENQDKYDKVYIGREQGRPSIYYFFYGQIDPKIVQLENKIALKDKGEFLEFGKIKFYLPEPEQIKEKSLIIIGGTGEFKGRLIKEINFLDYKPAFKIYEI